MSEKVFKYFEQGLNKVSSVLKNYNNDLAVFLWG